MIRFAVPTLFALLLASPAHAATIDFGSEEFAAAAGSASYETTIDGIGVTISVAPADQGAVIGHSSDGLGVDFDDTWASQERQIEGEEILTVEFDQLVDVSELTVTNLYDWGAVRIEVGTYTIDETTTEFTAENQDGTLTVPVAATPTTTISFRADQGWSWLGPQGFTLESISFSATGDEVAAAPELDPNAASGAGALLLGTALLVSERRRDKNA